MPKKAQKLPRTLSIEEVYQMFNASIDNPRDNFLLKFMFFTAMRNDEVRRQRIEDIDLINGVVHVRMGKGKKDRKIPIPDFFIQEIKDYLMLIGRTSGYLFEGRDEFGRMSDRHIRRIVKKYAKLAGLRNWWEVHPHTFRHSYATFLRNKGVPLDVMLETD